MRERIEAIRAKVRDVRVEDGLIGGDDRITVLLDAALAEAENVEADRSYWIQAMGLVSTSCPALEIDCDDPLGMAADIVAHFAKRDADFNPQPSAEREGK